MGIVVVAALAATAVEGGNHGSPTELFSDVFTKLRFYANFSRHSHVSMGTGAGQPRLVPHGGLNRGQLAERLSSVSERNKPANSIPSIGAVGDQRVIDDQAEPARSD